MVLVNFLRIAKQSTYMALRQWNDPYVIETHLANPDNRTVIAYTMAMAPRFGGDARTATGRVMTTEVYEKWKHKVLSKPMP